MKRRLGAPAWVVPRRSGARNPGWTPNDTRTCARGAADPAAESDSIQNVAAAAPQTGRPPGGVMPGFSVSGCRYPPPQLRRSAWWRLRGPAAEGGSRPPSSGQQRVAACVKKLRMKRIL